MLCKQIQVTDTGDRHMLLIASSLHSNLNTVLKLNAFFFTDVYNLEVFIVLNNSLS